MRIWFRLFITQVALLSTVSSQAALIDATSSISAKCHIGPAESLTGVPEEASASCSETTPGPITSSAAVATSFGRVFPRVGEVVASASLTRGEVVGAPSTTFASGVVSYYFAVEEVGIAPFIPDTVPFLFRASGEVSVTGDTTVPSGAQASIPGISGAFIGVELIGPGHIEFDESIALSAEIGVPYSVLVGALCDLRLGAPGTETTCAVTADPVLTFDQEAFDATQPDAYLLKDFFEITYSANVKFEPPPESIPEPSSLGLLGATLLILSGMRVRRRGLPLV
jgi:hypothetical protein